MYQQWQSYRRREKAILIAYVVSAAALLYAIMVFWPA